MIELTNEQIEAELRLFKSYTDDKSLFIGDLNERALASGIVVRDPIKDDILDMAIDMYGIKAKEWNTTFHKSFETVKSTPIEILVAQQILHYFSTYGLEELGVFSHDTVYIPSEKLDIPEYDGELKLAVISKITELELSLRLLDLLKSGIALSRQTVLDILKLSDFIPKTEYDSIKNNEIKIALYEKYNVVPKDATMFLRYLVYKLTESTLFIKSPELLNDLYRCDKNKAYSLLQNYISNNEDGMRKLSEIYRTHRKIFVALKSHNSNTNKDLNSLVNKLKHLSKATHKRMIPSVLDRLTSVNKYNGKKFYYNPYVNAESAVCDLCQLSFSESELREMLDKITIYREIRILNAIRYNLSELKSLDTLKMYRIRNSKAFITNKHNYRTVDKIPAQKALNKILELHLIDRLGHLSGKSVYVPDNVNYVVPTSEKQFLGNFPIGTQIKVPRDSNMIVGVHWKNVEDKRGLEERVDLDLHAVNSTEHIGWNGAYDNANIIFSGDVTDAPIPSGASEYFLIKRSAKNTAFVLNLKNFTQTREDVPFEFIIAKADCKNIDKNYIVNPNDIVLKIDNKFQSSGNGMPDITLGTIEITGDEIILTFDNVGFDKSIARHNKVLVEQALECATISSKTRLMLSELLSMAGCELLNEPYSDVFEEVGKDEAGEPIYKKIKKSVDYDFSSEGVTKDSFIKLLSNI